MVFIKKIGLFLTRYLMVSVVAMNASFSGEVEDFIRITSVRLKAPVGRTENVELYATKPDALKLPITQLQKRWGEEEPSVSLLVSPIIVRKKLLTGKKTIIFDTQDIQHVYISFQKALITYDLADKLRGESLWDDGHFTPGMAGAASADGAGKSYTLCLDLLRSKHGWQQISHLEEKQ